MLADVGRNVLRHRAVGQAIWRSLTGRSKRPGRSDRASLSQSELKPGEEQWQCCNHRAVLSDVVVQLKDGHCNQLEIPRYLHRNQFEISRCLHHSLYEAVPAQVTLLVRFSTHPLTSAEGFTVHHSGACNAAMELFHANVRVVAFIDSCMRKKRLSSVKLGSCSAL
jgi:hypothetical protein